MSVPIIGILVSTATLTILSLLFHFEKQRGARFLEGVRRWFDDVVHRGEKKFAQLTRYVGREMVRQTALYIFHTLLTFLLRLLERCEAWVKRTLRMNHSLAKKAARDKHTRNKLDAIAEHKLAVALSEEEKQKRKEEMLG